MQDEGGLTILKHGIRKVIKVFNPQEEKWFMTRNGDEETSDAPSQPADVPQESAELTALRADLARAKEVLQGFPLATKTGGHCGTVSSYDIENGVIWQAGKVLADIEARGNRDAVLFVSATVKEVVNSCPMDECLAPQRLKLLESFHTEVKRIMNEEDSMVNIDLALNRALARIAKGELQCPIETQSRSTSVAS